MTKQITAEELAKLNDINNRYTELYQEIGVNHTQIKLRKDEIRDLEEANVGLYADFNTLVQEHKVIGEELTSKYGEGSLDLTTGVITVQ